MELLLLAGLVGSGVLAFVVHNTSMGRRDTVRQRESWRRVARDFALTFREVRAQPDNNLKASMSLEGTVDGGNLSLMYRVGAETQLSIHCVPQLTGEFALGTWGSDTWAQPGAHMVQIGEDTFDRWFGCQCAEPSHVELIATPHIREALNTLREHFEEIVVTPQDIRLTRSKPFVEAGSMKDALSTTFDLLFALRAASMIRTEHAMQAHVL